MEYKREPVKGYEEYQVDTNGVVYSKKGKPLKWSINTHGYGMIKFCINGQVKGFGVHTIVARQFIPGETEERNQVNHIDGNKLNNNVDNLEWVTQSENIRHAIDILGVKLGEYQKENSKKIIGSNIKTGDVISVGNVRQTAEYLYDGSIDIDSIRFSLYRAIEGQTKQYCGYVWKYI